MRIIDSLALLCLVAPTCGAAFWYRYEWGRSPLTYSFGISEKLGLLTFVILAAFTANMGYDGIVIDFFDLTLTGFKRSYYDGLLGFLWVGIACASVIFPKVVANDHMDSGQRYLIAFFGWFILLYLLGAVAYMLVKD